MTKQQKRAKRQREEPCLEKKRGNKGQIGLGKKKGEKPLLFGNWFGKWSSKMFVVEEREFFSLFFRSWRREKLQEGPIFIYGKCTAAASLCIHNTKGGSNTCNNNWGYRTAFENENDSRFFARKLLLREILGSGRTEKNQHLSPCFHRVSTYHVSYKRTQT